MPDISQLMQIETALRAADGYLARSRPDNDEFGATIDYPPLVFFATAAADLYDALAQEALGPDFEALRSHCEKRAAEARRSAEHYRKLELNKGNAYKGFEGFDGIRHPRISPD